MYNAQLTELMRANPASNLTASFAVWRTLSGVEMLVSLSNAQRFPIGPAMTLTAPLGPLPAV